MKTKTMKNIARFLLLIAGIYLSYIYGKQVLNIIKDANFSNILYPALYFVFGLFYIYFSYKFSKARYHYIYSIIIAIVLIIRIPNPLDVLFWFNIFIVIFIGALLSKSSRRR